MNYNGLALTISALLGRLGRATSLIQTTKTRAATGGAITTVVTELTVNAAVVSDETTYVDAKPTRVIRAYLSGADPSVGDQLALPDGNHRIEKVRTIQPADVLIAYEVTLS